MPDSGAVERLDRFELIAELASGGMATVYLARLGGVGGFQRFVAIKRLHPHLAKEHEFIQMFLDEARLAARLHHPNVVPILEIGTSDQGYYLVMEYIEGDTLARLLARSAQTHTTLPRPVAVRVILDSLAGLHAAHELVDDDGKPLEIVHRDVSPQNILLGVDGSSRITDFGVARAASRLTTTRSGQLKGKLAYMAPEQARGKGVDRRADLFAMGIVLWESLAQRRLFKGEGEADTLNRVINEPIPELSQVQPAVPAEMAKVAMRALSRDLDHRYATAAQFADALERAASDAGDLGSNRDVAQYLDQMIGTDISQTRAAVRAWLSRSEPSRSKSAPPPSPWPSDLPKPSELASQTRVEAGKASSSSAPSGISRSGVSRSGVSRSGIPQSGIPQSGIPQSGIPQSGIPRSGISQSGVSPGGAVSGVSGAHGQVTELSSSALHSDPGISTVSSAVIALPGAQGSPSAPPPPPESQSKGRTFAKLAVAGLALFAAVIAVVGARSRFGGFATDSAGVEPLGVPRPEAPTGPTAVPTADTPGITPGPQIAETSESEPDMTIDERELPTVEPTSKSTAGKTGPKATSRKPPSTPKSGATAHHASTKHTPKPATTAKPAATTPPASGSNGASAEEIDENPYRR